MNTQSDFEELLKLFEENNIKFGIEPVRIDLLNKIDGVLFDNIKARTVRGRYGEITVSFISKEDLITNKKASARAQDIADLEKLEQ